MSADEALARAVQPAGAGRGARERLDGTEDPEQAIEILQELSELAKQVDAEIERARARGGGGCRGRLRSCASSSRRTSATWR